ncbi:MAG TPA: prolyl oligopeptidase family serine peptidase [Candidatus Didemnitutus sp.]|nr:prolyl oligopeptidase family serine peptidase [Candidatus Didemnitutus sp.]
MQYFHRTLVRSVILAGLVGGIPRAGAAEGPSDDPYLWLEDINGAKPLEWVRAHDEATEKRLTADPAYAGLYRDALTVLDSKSRIPSVDQHGDQLYNFWRDQEHPRGVWRRVSLAGFRAESPAWETVLDVDALAKAEGKAWAFGGVTWLKGDNRHCLVHLSVAGGDTIEVREFDAQARAFVAGGFVVPPAKSRVSWLDADTIFVGTDFGPGTLTDSGYPAQVKIWHRGTPLAAAQLLYTGKTSSVAVSAYVIRMDPEPVVLVSEGLTFWEQKLFQYRDGRLVALNVPATARIVDGIRGRLVIDLKAPWTLAGKSYAAGSIILADPSLLRGEAGTSELLVEPSGPFVVSGVAVTDHGIYVHALDNVRGRLLRFTKSASGWQRESIAFPDNGAMSIVSTNDETGEAWVQYESFLNPPSLYYVGAMAVEPELVKAQAPAFDGSRFEVKQLFATSADGTRIPYFLVQPKGMKYDGTRPIWMFSYGGFENSLVPSYSGSYEDMHGAYGKLWLERGGAFVLANIRGGGEFGPTWHTSVLNAGHLKTIEDFEAVAADLSARKITSPAHLGIEGRSNGGLLVSATMVRHPELYGAVVCGNPLIDMKRYSHLLAGASWMAEYGNPDIPEQWNFLKTYSPYQNIVGGKKLPPVLFYTTTHDDRVHPGHARKMAAKMEALGYPVEYAENTEGGHHGSVTNEQLAKRLALSYTFLWEKIK